jgi:hypothetical protein
MAPWKASHRRHRGAVLRRSRHVNREAQGKVHLRREQEGDRLIDRKHNPRVTVPLSVPA